MARMYHGRRPADTKKQARASRPPWPVDGAGSRV